MPGPLGSCFGRYLHLLSSRIMASLMNRCCLQGSELHWSALQNGEVQFGAVQCSAVQCSAVQCSAEQISAVQFSAVHCNVIHCSYVHQVVQYIKHGNMLECPENTPKSVYKLMTMCWSSNPSNRPCFRYCFFVCPVINCSRYLNFKVN